MAFSTYFLLKHFVKYNMTNTTTDAKNDVNPTNDILSQNKEELLTKYKTYLNKRFPIYRVGEKKRNTKTNYFYTTSAFLKEYSFFIEKYFNENERRVAIHWMNEYVMAKPTSNTRRPALICFLEFLEHDNPKKVIIRPKNVGIVRNPMHISFQEMTIITNALEQPYKIVIEMQMLTLSRISEILYMRENQWRLDNENNQIYFKIMQKKGTGKTAYLTPEGTAIFQQYHNKYCKKHKITDLVFKEFLTNTHNSYQKLWYVVKKVAQQEIGINIGTHTFRRSMAVYMFNMGVDLRTLQRLLGHHSIDMTMRYLETAGIDSKNITIKYKDVLLLGKQK